ncbi:MAG: lysophospholipid acyltransferase family protein [Gammaproteobacteria bacterium]
MVRLARIPAIIFWLFMGIGLSSLVALAGPWKQQQRRLRIRVADYWLSGALRFIGVHVRIVGQPQPGTVLFAANHVTWMDILVLSSVCHARFVAKAEVGSWPLLGWFAKEGGTVFIRRGDNASFAAVVERMRAELMQGERLIFFPEGTTSNGRKLRRFRSRLFGAASEPGVWVQPVGLRYAGAGDANERIPFIGDETIFANLWRILALSSVDAEMVFFDPLPGALHSPKELAHACEKRIGLWMERSVTLSLEERLVCSNPEKATDVLDY